MICPSCGQAEMETEKLYRCPACGDDYTGGLAAKVLDAHTEGIRKLWLDAEARVAALRAALYALQEQVIAQSTVEGSPPMTNAMVGALKTAQEVLASVKENP